jgi:hypothetical protein
MQCAVSPIMVNGSLPVVALRRRHKHNNFGILPGAQASHQTNRNEATAPSGFAQFLGKLNFFKLGENLQRILFDYAEKRASTTNTTFKCAC